MKEKTLWKIDLDTKILFIGGLILFILLTFYTFYKENHTFTIILFVFIPLIIKHFYPMLKYNGFYETKKYFYSLDKEKFDKDNISYRIVGTKKLPLYVVFYKNNINIGIKVIDFDKKQLLTFLQNTKLKEKKESQKIKNKFDNKSLLVSKKIIKKIYKEDKSMILHILKKIKTYFLLHPVKSLSILVFFILLISIIYNKELLILYDNFFITKTVIINYTLGIEYINNVFYINMLSNIFKIILYVYISIFILYTLTNIYIHKDIKKIYFSIDSFIVISFHFISLYLVLPLLSIFILFPAIYTIYNFIQQDFMNISFWKQEINGGYIAIRIASISIFMYFITLIIKLNSLKSSDNQNDKLGMILISNLGQLGYYGAIIMLIIFSTAFNNNNNLIVVIMSWLLLFILDDWKVMYDYSVGYSKDILFIHQLKLVFINIILSILSIILFYQIFSLVNFILLSIFLIGVLYISQLRFIIQNSKTTLNNKT